MSALASQNFTAVSLARPNPLAQPENIRLVPSFQTTTRPALPSEPARESLPLSATPNDLRDVIRFLKLRPAGISIVEALGEVKKRLLDPVKIATYEQWGVISRQGDWLKLSALGWEFSRKLAHEADLFRTILDRLAPYRAMLEQAQQQRLSLITHDDVVKYWRVHFSHLLDLQTPKNVASNVVCFLHLCQAAELGTLTIGKRGQPARLRVEFEELEAYLHSSRLEITADGAVAEQLNVRRQIHPSRPASSRAKIRLYLSLQENSGDFMQLHALLEMLGFAGEIIERQKQSNVPLAEKNFDTLRNCEAGLIIITEADCVRSSAGEYTLTPEIQMEISAAYLFFNRRVILLRESKIQIPAYWQNILTCEFENDQLDWSKGIALTKALLSLNP